MGEYFYIIFEIDLSQLLYSFWRVGIIMSKLKINYALIKYIYITTLVKIIKIYKAFVRILNEKYIL